MPLHSPITTAPMHSLLGILIPSRYTSRSFLRLLEGGAALVGYDGYDRSEAMLMLAVKLPIPPTGILFAIWDNKFNNSYIQKSPTSSGITVFYQV